MDTTRTSWQSSASIGKESEPPVYDDRGDMNGTNRKDNTHLHDSLMSPEGPLQGMFSAFLAITRASLSGISREKTIVMPC